MCEKNRVLLPPFAFFSLIDNPEEDKLWGTQRGSGTDLHVSSTFLQPSFSITYIYICMDLQNKKNPSRRA